MTLSLNISGSAFRLLTPGNPKVAKGTKKGFMTFILHLAPAKLSGYEVCPMRSKGCTAACLNTAGRGGMIAGRGPLTHADVERGIVNTVQAARIRRTKRFFQERETFMMDLVWDIEKAIRWSAKRGLTPVFRLNGTSDLRWESVPVARKVAGEWQAFRNICEAFPDVQFYDYTKLTNRKNVPANYDLTFSAADGNAEAVDMVLRRGDRVAMVFRTVETVSRYIETGLTISTSVVAVVDGDDSDLRFLEPKGVVVGLYAKGRAKTDTSGFVVD